MLKLLKKFSTFVNQAENKENFDRTVFKTKIIFLFFFAGSPIRGVQSRASYIETFPSCDVSESQSHSWMDQIPPQSPNHLSWIQQIYH